MVKFVSFLWNAKAFKLVAVSTNLSFTIALVQSEAEMGGCQPASALARKEEG